ncbi:MAG TPA: GTPase Era [Candidatus Binatia bacterium]|jgi:GTP-binding protein Era|nr:GTPase Era [Candidatus Binatia bacterium]
MTEEKNESKEKSAGTFRSGYVAIIGRPNVGKSTLLNKILGEKVAIVSPKPQTTRNRITGIRTTDASQIIFIDTPGIHQGHSLMNRRMMDTALQTLDEVDGVLWLLDAHEKLKQEEERIAETLRGVDTPVLILLNKIDLVSKGKLLPLMERCAEVLPGKEIVPVSALKGDGLEITLNIVEKWLPKGPRYFTEGEYTDQSERFLASEIVREKVFLLTREEIPYGVAVTIDEFTEKEEKNLIVIAATIHTDRDSHKGILIGKRGAMLKEIGRQAREELEALLGCRIFLELFVRVDANWTRNPNLLTEMGL